MLRTYNDTNMSNLNGKFLKYYESGILGLNGQYNNNEKNGDWFYYNNSGKIIIKETYSNNKLVRKENPNTLEKENSESRDKRKPEFTSGTKGWNSYLQHALLKMPSELFSLKGKIEVMFTINIEGKTTEIYLKKSAQFGLDEEALKIIRLSPLWKSASQNKHAVNTYRLQPFTFVGEQ